MILNVLVQNLTKRIPPLYVIRIYPLSGYLTSGPTMIASRNLSYSPNIDLPSSRDERYVYERDLEVCTQFRPEPPPF